MLILIVCLSEGLRGESVSESITWVGAMAEVVLDANPTLSSLPAELLAHIMRECDETSAASSAFTSHAHGLSIAARLWCATNAAQAASALGLAWAAQLPLAADMLATDVTLLPPATVMRFLSLSALERDLQSDLLWIPDEEARYTIAAAWLRAAPRPTGAAEAVLRHVRLGCLTPCACERVLSDGLAMHEPLHTWRQRRLDGQCPLASSGTWTFGFAVPLKAGSSDPSAAATDEDSDGDNDGAPPPPPGAHVRRVPRSYSWGSSPLWLSGAHLHLAVEQQMPMMGARSSDSPWMQVALRRVRGAGPAAARPEWSVRDGWPEGLVGPIYAGGAQYDVSAVRRNTHLEACAACRAAAPTAPRHEAIFSHNLYFADDGRAVRHAAEDEEEGWKDDDDDDDDEGVGEEEEKEGEHGTWANGSGVEIALARRRWCAHAEGAPGLEFVGVVLVVKAFAVGYRPCRACGKLEAESIW